LNKNPTATEDINSGTNQSTLQTVAFFPAKSTKVARARPIGIWIQIERIITTMLFLKDAQKLPSVRSFFQLLTPINSLSADIPFHL